MHQMLSRLSERLKSSSRESAGSTGGSAGSRGSTGREVWVLRGQQSAISTQRRAQNVEFGAISPTPSASSAFSALCPLPPTALLIVSATNPVEFLPVQRYLVHLGLIRFEVTQWFQPGYYCRNRVD